MTRRCAGLLLGTLLALGGCGSGTSAGGTGGAWGGTPGGGAVPAGGVVQTTAAGGNSAVGDAGQGAAGDGGSCQPLTTDGFSRVSGPTFGVSLLGTSDLRKTITARDTAANPSFSVGTAWIVDPTRRTGLSSSSFALVFVSINNRGSAPACGVTLNNVTYRDGGGADVTQQYGCTSTANVAAQTARICSLSFQGMPDCLAPGQTSWSFHTLSYVGVDLSGINITSVDFALSSNTTYTYGEPGYRIAARSYTVDTAADGTQTLNVTLANLGPSAVTLGALAEFFVLDSDDTPLDFGNLPANGTLQPQQTITVSRGNLVFDGSATRLVVLPWSNGVL